MMTYAMQQLSHQTDLNYLRRSRADLLFAAIAALSLGLCIYLIDRQPETAYLISNGLFLNDNVRPVFGVMGNYLPTFLHVYAFILLSAAVFAQSHRQVLIICLSWLIIEIIFELAQINIIAQSVAIHIPDWFSVIPVVNNTANYFLMGTFDILDIISIIAGTLIAYMTISLSSYLRSKPFICGAENSKH